MLIDWFTVGAQALNFLILVWLMRRFLYKPVLHAINEREKRIAAELADADTKKAEAQKESDQFKHKNKEFDQQRAGLLEKATGEVKAEGQRLLEEARKAAAALSLKRQEALRNEEHNLHQMISRRTEHEVFAIVRKALTDLATTGLEERLGEVFTRRLGEMDGQAKATLAVALKTASDPVLVRSAFALPAEQRATIQNALNETFSADVHIRFETAPDLISGIELTTNGQKVAWSIADYLASMEKGVDELLKEKDKSEAKARTSSDLTPQIAKRAYELYEKHGRTGSSSAQDWSEAEREIRNDNAKAKPEPETKAKAKPEPETKAKLEPEAKTKPDAKAEPEAEAKPEAKVKPDPEPKVEPKPEAEAKPEPEPKVEPEPEAEAKPEPEAKTKPEAKAKAEPKAKPETKAKAEAKAEPKPEAKAKPDAEAEPEAKPEPDTKSQ